MRDFSYYLKRPKETAYYIFMKTAHYLPDSLHLYLLFRIEMGYWPNLTHPKTFCEKLQWLKLHNRKEEYTMMVDKLAVKEYAAKIMGHDSVIPVIGIWNKIEDIDFDSLPNQFVLKTSQGGGGNVIICKDKSQLDIVKTKRELRVLLNQNIYKTRVEWPYKNVTAKIFAEKYMVDESGCELKDYKILNFNGVPTYIEVDSGRFTDHFRNIYDTNWNILPYAIGFRNNPSVEIERPANLEQMLHFARIFSQVSPFLRTDFYIINNKLYFGELTFFQRSGLTKFCPSTLDLEFGNMISLTNL